MLSNYHLLSLSFPMQFSPPFLQYFFFSQTLMVRTFAKSPIYELSSPHLQLPFSEPAHLRLEQRYHLLLFLFSFVPDLILYF
jgi:hypothetical protein